MHMSVDLSGLGDTKNAIRDYVETIKRGVAALVEEYTYRIMRGAKGRVPFGTGDLRASIRAEVEAGAAEVVGRVTAGQGLEDPDIAAFIEFGTGRRVNVPPGLEDYAMQFYRNGKGMLPASPYLFPAFEQHWRDFLSDLETLIKTGKMP